VDLVFDELNLRLRSEGEARAEIERSVLVERAVAKRIQRHNIEVAITWLVMAKQLVEKDNMLRFAHRGATCGNCRAPREAFTGTGIPSPIRRAPIPW
jgi:hypothetical protein